MARGSDTLEGQAKVLGAHRSLGIEVPHHFHVVRGEANRHDHDRTHSFGCQLRKLVLDVRLQPGNLRWSTARLVHQRPRHLSTRESPNTGGNKFAHLQVLVHVGISACTARLGHAQRNGVRGEEHVQRLMLRYLRDGCCRAGNEGFDEPGMVVVRAEPFDDELACPYSWAYSWACGLQSVEDVLSILPTTGVRRVRRGEERQCALHARRPHLAHCVRQQWVPVSISPEHREVDSAPAELGTKGGKQLSILLVDWADSTKVLVVGTDCREPLSRDATATRHILKEGHDVVWSLRPTE